MTSRQLAPDAIEDRFDRLHGVLGLLLDRVRMDVLVILMRMVVVERRRRRPRQEHQVAGADDLDRRRVRHLVRLRRIGMHDLQLEGLVRLGVDVHGRPSCGWGERNNGTHLPSIALRRGWTVGRAGRGANAQRLPQPLVIMPGQIP